ncbi:MAG TPA: CHAT domain-containing protein [Ignavibacteriaceae bacterium]|nr:CHAT domain-containing protein [Ignavibacteriaceae bacterium]
MIVQKVIILIIVLVISLFKPGEINSDPKDSSFKNINTPDSIKSEIVNQGWTREILQSFHHYLVNSQIPAEKEFTALKDIPEGYRKAFLKSILYKKENKFSVMYDSLSYYLNDVPHYLPWYDELVYAANATNRLTVLESRVGALNEFPQLEKNYLLGLIKYHQADYEASKEFFEKSLKNDSTNKYILYQLSYAYRSLGDYKTALTYIKEAGINAKEDLYFQVKIRLAEGALYYLSGDYNSADKIYKDSFKLSNENNLKEVEGSSYVALGIMDDIQGFIDKAREKYSKAIEISGNIQNIELRAYALSELGVSYSYTNNLIEARENYLDSYKLYKMMGNKLRLSLLSDNIGKIYMSIFNYEDAIKCYREGIDFAGDYKRALVLNLTGLADAYSNLGNYSEALRYYNQAKKLSADINEIELGINVNGGLGALNYNLNRPNNALSFYQKAESECNKINNPFLTADIYDKLGIIYLTLDSLNIAENYFRKAVDLAQKNNASYTEVLAGLNLSETFTREKNNAEALNILNKSIKSAYSGGFPYLQARAEILKGNVFKDGNDFENAKSSYMNALNIVKNLHEKNLEIEASYDLAELYDSKGMNDPAETYYSSAIKIIEDVSRPLFSSEDVQIAYFSGNREVYDSFAEHFLKNYEYEEAFELINKSHSRNMIQNLNNLKLQSMIKDSAVVSKLYDYDWIIHSGIYDNEKTLAVKKEMDDLKLSLINKNPDLAPYLNMEKWPSLDDIKNSLDEKENLVSYYSTKQKTYAFLITRDSFKPFVFDVSKENLTDLITNISPFYDKNVIASDAFYNQDLFSFNAKAADVLYKKIVEPIVHGIPAGQKIIISPSTELISLPFEFLVTDYNEAESPYDYKNKKYLIMDYEISYSPSVTAFIKQQKNDLKNDGKVLLVGDPAINTGTEEFAERRGLLDESPGIGRNFAFLPLKYSGEEISSIGQIINANTILLNNNATETNFKQNAALSRIIHLSTHSFLFNRQPLIFFSNTYDAENDGFLEASEIVQLKLNSDLVVLSSCNSGLGSVDESEGILGLTKAFFEAGTKSIVVSLWDVNDKYTSRFMTLFYKNLSMGYDKSKALQQAKIEFIKDYSPNPYYWGAFVLAGNISPVQIRNNRNMSLSLITFLTIISAAVVVVLIFKRKRIKV